ncbi:unnamed protein product, partial [Brenthis ino]
MLLLFLLFTYAFAAANVTGVIDVNDQKLVFRKCCARYQNLVKVSETNKTTSEHYICMDSDKLEKNYNVFSNTLYVSSGIVVKEGFPTECSDLQMVQINKTEAEIFSNQDDCYDRLVAEIVDGTLIQSIPNIVAIACNRSDVEIVYDNKLRIHKIHKCCPKGQSYDTEYHQCIRKTTVGPDDNDWLAQLKINFGDIFKIEYDFLCNANESAVELHERAYHLSIEGDTLFALSRNGEKYGRSMSGKWCIDQEYNHQGLVAQVCTQNCDTFSAFCVRKCCPLGQHYKLRKCGTYISTCVPNDDEDVRFNISTYLDPLKKYDKNLLDVMGVRIGLLECTRGRYGLNSSLMLDQHNLTTDARLQTRTTLTNNYCVEVFDRRDCPTNDIIVNGVLCFVPPKEIKNYYISFIIITISCICLVLTLFVYCVLPELRNLHGRTLICHVSMMLLACTCLARVQHSQVHDERICTFLGYAIYFGFVAAFAWLNVMCFDIWWTFGSMRTVKPLRKTASECRRFIWYSLYAWSFTILLTLTMFFFDRYPVATVLDANIGNGICWFGAVQNTQEDWPHYIFFVIPMGIVTCINFILWLLTARHCAQVKSEVHRLQAGSVGDRAKRRFRIDRAKYILTGKLWVVMGAGWGSELLSTIVSQPLWLWNIVDLFNELQGVFIFIILVVKPKVYYLIRKRLGLEKPGAQNNATSSSSRTSSTFLSRTISSDERTNLRISLPNKQC